MNAIQETTMARAKATADAEGDAVAGNVAEEETWCYHATKPPRLFHAGEVIPEDWADSPKAFATDPE